MRTPRVNELFVAAICCLTVVHASSLFQITIEAINSPVSLSLTNRFILAYSLIEPSIVIKPQIPENFSAAKTKLFSHETDIMMVPYSISELDALVNPSIVHIPFVAIPVVPVFNLYNITSLNLSISAVASIWLGRVTRWSHPLIAADNPSITLPDEDITVILPAAATFQSRVFVRTLRSLDATFAGTIPQSDFPAWPRNMYARTLSSSVQGPLVLATPYSISFTTWQDATQLGSNIAAMQTASGTFVHMSQTALDLALNTAATVRIQEILNPKTNQTAVIDLTSSYGAGSWPIIATEYMWFDLTYSRQTCASRLAMVNYLLWLYTSEDVRTILTSQQVALMPQVVIDEMDILGRLVNSVMCRGSPAKATQVVNGITVSGDPRTDTVNSLLLIDYNADFKRVDDSAQSYEYRWTANPSALAIEQVLFREVSLALVFSENAGPLWDEAIVGNSEFITLPTFLFGVVLVINPIISSKTTLPTGTRLVLTLELAFGLFSGTIRSWKHAGILALNPDIAEAFTSSNDDTDATIWSVLACDSFQSSKMGYFILTVLGLRDPRFEPFRALLSSSSNLCKSGAAIAGLNVHLVSSESQIGPTVGQQVGSFGYQQFGVHNPNVAPFGVLIGSTVRTASPDSMLACARDTLDPISLLLPAATSSHPECYPFTQTMYMVSPTAYNMSVRGPGSCVSGGLTIDYGLHLLNQSSNDQALHLAGIVRISEDPVVSEVINHILQESSFTCDGVPMLEAKPIEYEVNASLKGFANAMAAIGMAACAVGLVVLIMHRHHPVVLASKLGLLIVSSIGCMMLFAALVPLVQKADDASCSSLMWLINIGYTLLFIPSYVKLARLYLMHNGGAMVSRVHKLTSQSMHIILTCAIVLDIAVLAAWQGVSPFAPVTTSRLEDVPPIPHLYTQCGQPDDGLPFLYAVGLVKGLMLVCGAVVAYSVHRVMTTFNEQKHAALLMYNTVAAISLCVPIAFVTSLLGDSWTVIFVICVLWIVVVAWVCITVPKFIAIASQKSTRDILANAMTHTDAVKSVSLGFSFHQIGLMSQEVLESYIKVVEEQVNEAKQKLMSSASDVAASSPSHAKGGHPELQHSDSMHRRKLTMGGR